MVYTSCTRKILDRCVDHLFGYSLSVLGKCIQQESRKILKSPEFCSDTRIKYFHVRDIARDVSMESG